MSRAERLARLQARRRRTLSLCCFAALFGLVVLSVRTGRAGAEAGGALTAEPVLSATAAGVKTLFGASPQETPGEVWGVGQESREGGAMVRYTEAGGWEAMPAPTDAEGNPVSLTRTAIPTMAAAGRTTPAGGVVTVASLGAINSLEPQALLTRDPGGQFQAIAPPEAPIVSGTEKLFSAGSVRLTAVEEPGGDTGAFVVPAVGGAINKQVLHWDGSQWTAEPICLSPASEPCTKKPATGFAVIAIEGTSPENAWILAKQPRHTGSKSTGEGIVLLKRTGAGEWRRQPFGGALGTLFEQEEPEVGGTKVYPAVRETGQPLTVSPTGIWVDASIRIGSKEAAPEGATLFYDPSLEEVTSSWCDLGELNPAVGAAYCTRPLGLELPTGEGRSFAWPGNGGVGEESGTRVITGVGHGALAIFENGSFTKVPLDGNGGSSAGAALTAPDEGWLGPSYRLTRLSIQSSLQSWPVPFRRPLTAIAGQPGEPVGALGSQAIAVGDGGQVARYIPSVGWQSETLLTGSGTHATPDLRAVAWPEAGTAYAVGDEGAMWLWRASTELWEPDPGAPVNLIRGNFTGIAFQPGEPDRGYAVGKQGLLLAYGKRWTQEALPVGLDPEVNITSIAFAGSEALATYTIPVSNGHETTYTGGLLVNDGSGWRVEEEAAKVLTTAEGAGAAVAPRRVAGLPDGGAVLAGITGGVIERESAGAPWHAVPGAPLGYPAAVAAVREGGQLRAILSVEGNPLGGFTPGAEEGTDESQATGQPQQGQPPLLTSPYPLPKNGYVVRQTATGWRDEEHDSYPPPARVPGQGFYDLPRTPDAVLALLINPEGSEGWAVGGNTGEEGGAESYQREAIQTAAAMRIGAAAAPPENTHTAPISLPSNAATFAIGGNASCVGPCAEEAGTGIGPDVWLRAAVGKAAGIQGLRAFLYTGSSVAEGDAGFGRLAFGEEEAAYARRLGSAAGSLPVYAAPASTDRYNGSLSIFSSRFEGFQWPFGQTPPTATSGIVAGEPAADPSANDSYWFESTGPTGEHPVRVVVLDDSTSVSTETECWLTAQLAAARAATVPIIVVGNDEVDGQLEMRRILVSGESPLCPSTQAPGHASAYFYKSTSNRQQTLSWGAASMPAYGTGTLGYLHISEPASQRHTPASGFLLAAIGEPNGEDVAPVTVSLIPNIGSLAIDAIDGTLLRRSQPALFEALARRPLGGYSCGGSPASPEVCETVSPEPYVQIPDRCIRGYEGGSCASELLAEYRFTSSHPDIANFVEVDPASTEPRAVYLKNGKPVADAKSGLLCAFNAGTTTITVETGELSYSVPVTVQAGSVARPCGTVPLENQPSVPVRPTVPPPPLETSPPGGFTQPGGTIPPPHGTPMVFTHTTHSSPSTPPVHHPIKPPAHAQVPYFNVTNPMIAPIPVIVPPPPAPVLEPTPPTGTSPVTQPAVSPEPEEEEEAAFDMVHHMAAYRHERARNAASVFTSPASGGTPSLRYFVPALALLLALAGAGVATPRRHRPRLAYETRATPRRPYR